MKTTYLHFDLRNGENRYAIYNNKEELLGFIERIRVGQWMSWCLASVPSADIYFSAGCQDEIRAKCKELNGAKK